MKTFLALILVLYSALARAEFDISCFSGWRNYPTPGSFGEDTRISTPTGLRKIADIQQGDEVLAMNNQGKIVRGTVSKVVKFEYEKTCEITTSDGARTRLTANHGAVCLSDRNPIAPDYFYFDEIGRMSQVDTGYRELNVLGYLLPFAVPRSSLIKIEAAENLSISQAQRIKILYMGYPSFEDVYNIDVKVWHNYFANGILVNNIPR